MPHRETHSSSKLAGAALIVAAAVFAACSGEQSRRSDYLSPELRARVEQLKKEAASSPTTSENVQARAQLMWQWANAYALTGRAIPVNLPMFVSIVNVVQADGKTDVLPPEVQISWDETLRMIGAYIRELQVKDEDPDAIGTIRFEPAQPLRSRAWVTFSQVWTVGNLGMAQGGSLVLGQQWLSDQVPIQIEQPSAPNYVTIRSSNSSARFKAGRTLLFGMHGGGTREKTGAVQFVLEGAPLRRGDTVTVTYGDTSGGSRGLQAQSFSTDRLLLPLYLDLEAKGNHVTAEWPALEVVGDKAESAGVFAPSVVAPGEAFELSVRTMDEYDNRATGPIPGYDLTLDGRSVRRIAAGTSAITVLDGMKIDEPGTHRFAVRSDDGRITGTSNPVWVRPNPPQRIYWGETHGHTGYAEGQGSPEGYFRFGKDDSRLDFITLSEHDLWTDDFEWKTMQDLVRRYTQEGKFVAFVGYEWTGWRWRGGHHNVLFRTPEGKRAPFQVAHRLPMLYENLRRDNKPEDVLVIPHAHEPGDWTQNDPDLQKLVEIYSTHGTFDWFGNKFLQNGFEVGFVGASDDHRARPGGSRGGHRSSLIGRGGLGAALAPEKTTNAIFSALRSLATYATSGERIILDATCNGSRMGSRQTDTRERRIQCRAMGTSPIDQIQVVKNGRVVYGRSYLSAPLAAHSWVQIGFESSSEVVGAELDNPRPYRVWEGSVEVEGARVKSAVPVGFENHYLEWIKLDPQKPNRVEFSTRTRGRMDVLLVELEDAGPRTVFRFHLNPKTEYGQGMANVRKPQDLPGADVALRLADLAKSRVEHPFAVGPYTDRLSLQVVDAAGPLDQEFEFRDVDHPAAGDYYYVRVTQLDGGRAWSSPFWVGRKPERPATAAGR